MSLYTSIWSCLWLVVDVVGASLVFQPSLMLLSALNAVVDVVAALLSLRRRWYYCGASVAVVKLWLSLCFRRGCRRWFRRRGCCRVELQSSVVVWSFSRRGCWVVESVVAVVVVGASLSGCQAAGFQSWLSSLELPSRVVVVELQSSVVVVVGLSLQSFR